MQIFSFFFNLSYKESFIKKQIYFWKSKLIFIYFNFYYTLKEKAIKLEIDLEKKTTWKEVLAKKKKIKIE